MRFHIAVFRHFKVKPTSACVCVYIDARFMIFEQFFLGYI